MADYRRNRRPAADGDRERRGSDGSSHRTRARDSGRDRERGDRGDCGDRGDQNDRSRRHRSRYHDKDSNQDSRDRDRTRNDDRDRNRDRDRDVDVNRRDRDRKRRERDYDRGDSGRSERQRSASPARRGGSPAFVPPPHSHGGGPNKNLRRPMEQRNGDEGVDDDDEEDDEMGLLRNGRHTGLPNRTRARELAGSDGSTSTPSTAVAPMSFRVGRSDRRDEEGGRDGNRKSYDSRDENGPHERAQWLDGPMSGDSGDMDHRDRRYLEDDTSRENEAEDDIEVDDDGMDAMQAMMGFGSFASTKGTKVAGNNAGAVRKVKRTQYRQYMNRQGGFNRPLSPSR